MEMCDSGVVREFSPGKFLRVEASAASEPPQIKVVKDLASSPQSAPERSQKVEVKDGDEVISPIGLLNSIAIRVDALSEEAKSISADFVDVVVHIDDYICHVESKVEKMKQLQALLKSIGD